MNELLAYWLVPAEPYRGWFSEQIGKLAAHLGSATFLPHVTIYAGPGAGVDSPAAIIEEAARGVTAITLLTVRIDHSDKFTKTLFVEFAPEPELAAVSDRLRQLSATPADYELRPHLSLAYQHIGTEEREQLARSSSLPFETVLFDELHAVICPTGTDSAADVRAWRTVARHRLAPE